MGAVLGHWVSVLGRGPVLARIVAAAELALSLYLLLHKRGRKAGE